MRSGDRRAMSIPPLVSGGVMLSYQCSNECRHCLYRCSPRQPNDWMSLEMAERIFAALLREKGLRSIHIAGGEPFLRPGLLEEVVRLGVEMGVPIHYVETNAFWCVDEEQTREGLERLKARGLPAILVSVSMFHNEFVPFERTRMCVEVARRVFGRSVIVYLPHMLDLLSRMPAEQTHTLEEFCRFFGLPERSDQVPGLYQVIPAGRAVEALRPFYHAEPPEAFRGRACEEELLSTTHFHIDQHGDLFTGLCAGLAPASVSDLHPAITRESHPVFHGLCAEGPVGLARVAAEEFGFRARDDGYVSKCDLCLGVRRHLQATGRFPELRPASFYTA